MGDLYKQIGRRIRELRQQYGGKGLSQEVMAKVLKTTPNTISRWETGTYRPSANDLHRLAKFFRVSISVFFPSEENGRLQSLLSATGDMGKSDIDDLIEYARFRKARRLLEKSKKNRKR